MIEKLLDEIQKSFPLKKLDSGEFAKAKVNGMKFKISCYEAQGLGNVSVMHGVALLGLMKMDTLIVNPFEQDAPLFSYDRICAAGNDILFLEMFDTCLERRDMAGVRAVNERYAELPDSDAGVHWYQDIRYSESVKKKAKKAQTPKFDEYTKEYLGAYLDFVKNAPKCDREEKTAKAAVYTEGLLSHGGPSTDVFLAAYEREYVERLFRTVLFGTLQP